VTLQLNRDLVTYVHDILVNLWLPYDQIVHRDRFDDLGLLESALARPFQTFGGEELYPTLPAKAGALFHSLVCNHCFSNGNKRTAVIALHFFMLGNGRLLIITNQELYDLANETAEANRKGIKPDAVLESLTKFIESESVATADFTKPEVVEALGEVRLQKLIDRAEWTKQMLAKTIEDVQQQNS
jgi:death-on-curing family protein